MKKFCQSYSSGKFEEILLDFFIVLIGWCRGKFKAFFQNVYFVRGEFSRGEVDYFYVDLFLSCIGRIFCYLMLMGCLRLFKK